VLAPPRDLRKDQAVGEYRIVVLASGNAGRPTDRGISRHSPSLAGSAQGPAGSDL
jgi:hypothetical protein